MESEACLEISMTLWIPHAGAVVPGKTGRYSALVAFQSQEWSRSILQIQLHEGEEALDHECQAQRPCAPGIALSSTMLLIQTSSGNVSRASSSLSARPIRCPIEQIDRARR
jgi:hypothetical protein